jgi:hypothetical protein
MFRVAWSVMETRQVIWWFGAFGCLSATVLVIGVLDAHLGALVHNIWESMSIRVDDGDRRRVECAARRRINGGGDPGE